MGDETTKHGCCVDKANGSGRPCDESTCMELPAGKTCADCRHVRRCCTIFGMEPESTSCHIFPRRFLKVNP